ncbi:ribose transport system permease protein [Pullulanibacillus pueri]|uniref:Ribose ABC transporter permease n=2 Tax=Pullulanibacillus pueri TaxID=1437324 RepID=A0A8J3EN62_9BACL|nr:ribose transport system permease protein [Pullulanibacillus pueri]GGH86919.1 ribose ABC transporter permease [Pullulanibacillus pueri]
MTQLAKKDKVFFPFGQQLSFDRMRQYGLILALVVLFIVMSLVADNFFAVSNLMNIARQLSVTSIASVGMTLVILIGGIDLSVGSILALSGVMAAMMYSSIESPFLALFVGVLAGAAVGFFNGFVTAKGQIAGFITTLATMSAIRGLSYIFTDGMPISETSPSFIYIGTGYFWGIPIPIYIMIIILLLGSYIVKFTRFGRYIYAIGGNEQTSKWSGLKVDRVKIYVYTISGLLTGLAGVILASRLASGQPSAGDGFELDVIAGVIVGGTSLSGGKGNISGTFIGVLLIGILGNGLTLLNVSSYYQMVIKGGIIILAVLLDTLGRRGKD